MRKNPVSKENNVQDKNNQRNQMESIIHSITGFYIHRRNNKVIRNNSKDFKYFAENRGKKLLFGGKNEKDSCCSFCNVSSYFCVCW